MKPLAVTLDRCHELLEICEPSDFEKESGLKNKVTRNSRARAGSWAACVLKCMTRSGEIRKDWRIKIDGKYYLAARIIYLMAHGVDPYPHEIDHINRDSLDNRVENLRLGDRQLQGQNQGIRKDNKSGISGVSWDKARKKWKVSVKGNYLGRFTTRKEAAAAKNEGVRQYFLKETWEANLVDLDTIYN